MINTTSTYCAAAGTTTSYTFIIENNTNTTPVNITFIVADHATVRCEIVILSDAHVMVTGIMQGKHSSLTVHGAAFVRGQQRVIVETVQHHQAEHSTSSFLFKGIVEDSANLSYMSRICVDKNAHQSVSSLYNKNMLMGERARCFSVPSMEVLTDDVKAYHGSAISTCDESALIYGQARAIAPEQMKKLLIQSFFADMFVSDDIKKKVCEQYEYKI